MSTENVQGESAQNANGESADAATDTTSGNETDVTVNRSAEEYAKRLKTVSAEAKQHRQDLQSLKAKLKELEDDKMAKDGKKDELIQRHRDEAKAEKERAEKLESAFAFKVVKGEVKTAAIKAGCQNPEHLVKLLIADDKLDALDIGEDFEIDAEQVKSVMDEAQKEYPYLFGKSAPNVKDANPSNKVGSVPSLDKMSLKDRTRKLAELL